MDKFDKQLFSAAVRAAVKVRNLTARAAAKQADISPATMGRIMNGNSPEVATFSKLCSWMGEEPRRFFKAMGSAKQLETIADACTIIENDIQLSRHASEVLSAIVLQLYEAFLHHEP